MQKKHFRILIGAASTPKELLEEIAEGIRDILRKKQ